MLLVPIKKRFAVDISLIICDEKNFNGIIIPVCLSSWYLNILCFAFFQEYRKLKKEIEGLRTLLAVKESKGKF